MVSLHYQGLNLGLSLLKVVLVLATLEMGAMGKWEEPLTVIPSYNDFPAIFTDNATSVSHVLWCQSGSSRHFLYRRVYQNHTMSEVFNFHWPGICHLDYKISGLNDGKSLYVVYPAHRKSNSGQCSEDPDVCVDVYFVESADAGATWSTPIAVPRPHMNDLKDRQFPSFVVSAKNRLWIFYRMTGFYEAPYSYVSRPSGSSVFASEITLPIKVNNAQVVYSLNRTASVLSIFYTRHEDSHLYAYRTHDNGATWANSDVTGYCKPDLSFYALPYASPELPYHLFQVCNDDKYQMYLKISEDLGTTWHQLTLPNVKIAFRPTITGDGRRKGWYAFADYAVTYRRIDGKEFKIFKDLPCPPYTTALYATSTYSPPKLWYWYNVAGPNHTVTLLVTYNLNLPHFAKCWLSCIGSVSHNRVEWSAIEISGTDYTRGRGDRCLSCNYAQYLVESLICYLS